MPARPEGRVHRVGIIGTGGIARAHGQACRSLENVTLQAVCDVSQEAANRFGDEFEVPRRYLRLEEFLDAEELDIAVVSNWGSFHAETCIQLARYGQVRAILCEKPFASDAQEARRMVQAAKEHGVLITEAFKFRHHPLHRETQDLVEKGAIGDVKTIRSTFSIIIDEAGRRPDRNWRFCREKGGGSIYDLGCYAIHHARTVYRVEPVRVFASAQFGVEVDDAAFVHLVFPGDRTAQIAVGYNSWNSQAFEICGTHGILRTDRAWNNENQPVTLEVHRKEGKEFIHFEPTFAFTHQLRHLCLCLETGDVPRIPPENSVAQMKVIDAVYQSALTGSVVDLVWCGS